MATRSYHRARHPTALECTSPGSIAFKRYFAFSATGPEASSAFAAAVHDCAGIHGAHQYLCGPSACSRVATGTAEEEDLGQPCPLLQCLSWQHTVTSPGSSSGPAHGQCACSLPQDPLPPSRHPLVLCCPRGTACGSSPQPAHTDFSPDQLVSPGCHKHP